MTLADCHDTSCEKYDVILNFRFVILLFIRIVVVFAAEVKNISSVPELTYDAVILVLTFTEMKSKFKTRWFTDRLTNCLACFTHDGHVGNPNTVNPAAVGHTCTFNSRSLP
jgi:hypothetical protein